MDQFLFCFIERSRLYVNNKENVEKCHVLCCTAYLGAHIFIIIIRKVYLFYVEFPNFLLTYNTPDSIKYLT